MIKKKEPESLKSYAVLFLISVLLLIAASVWAVWDDAVTRRPWKAYQESFFDVMRSKHTKELEEKKALLQSDEYRRIADEYAELTEKYENDPDRKKASQELNVIEKKLAPLSQRFRSVRGKYQAIVYKMERNSNKQAKIIVDNLKRELNGIREKMKVFEIRRVEVREQLEEIGTKKIAHKNRLFKYRGEVEKAQRLLEHLEHRSPRILQIVNKEIGAIDRCMSCHAGIDKSNLEGLEGLEGVLASHPAVFNIAGKGIARDQKRVKNILEVHPVETFGCVICHKGQGYATTGPAAAHGEEKYWLTPLLRGEKVQSSCLKCHRYEINLPGAEKVLLGKRLFVKLGCVGCHAVKGVESVRIGPDLVNLREKVYTNWLLNWMKNPRKFQQDTNMPNFRFTESEVKKIASYLWQKSDSDWKPGIDKLKRGDVKKGEELFEDVGCLGCHSLGETGNKFAPNLNRIGEKLRYPYLVSWLLNPKKHQPKTVMPNFRLKQDEAEAIASFLITRKSPKFKGRLNRNEDFLNNPEEAEEGFRLISRYGCNGCHKINGLENSGKVGADLSLVGSKPIEQFDFGLLAQKLLHEAGLENMEVNVGRARELWIENKLKDPRVFDTGRVRRNEERLRMPDFQLSKREREALLIYLIGLTDEKIPEKYQTLPLPKERELIEGERIIEQHNCAGCHKLDVERVLLDDGIELTGETKLEEDGFLFFRLWKDSPAFGKRSGQNAGISVDKIVKRREKRGGDIAYLIADKVAEKRDMIYQEALAFAPPALYGVGRKLQPKWFYDYIRNPTRIRPWLKVKMPTFGLSDKQAQILTRYFMTLSNEEYPYIRIVEGEASYQKQRLKEDPSYYSKTKRLMDSKDVNCGTCHVRGNRLPQGPASGWAPDLSIAHKRLKPKWIYNWLKNPQSILPGTKMPKFPWEILGGVYPGAKEQRVKAVRDYLMKSG